MTTHVEPLSDAVLATLEARVAPPPVRYFAAHEQFETVDRSHLVALLAEVRSARSLLHAPELHDFSRAVALEAAHQRGRWGSAHDAGKKPSDWFWLLGYLGGKALHAAIAGDLEKALHHTISSAAVLANWHAALLGKTDMRPGIEPPPTEG